MSIFDDLDYMKKDKFFEPIFDSFVEGYVPQIDEIKTLVRFFATFAMGCVISGVEDLADKFNTRLEWYIILLKRLGYKPGRYGVGYKIFGLEDYLSGVLQVRV